MKDCDIHVPEQNMAKRLCNSHMNFYADRMDYITKQFQMIIKQGIQKEKDFLNKLREMAELTNDSNSDINLKQSEIMNLQKKMNKLSNELKSKDKQHSELGVKQSDVWKGERKLHDTIEKMQKQHTEIESLNNKIRYQSDLLKQVQSENNRLEKDIRQTHEQTKNTLKEKDANILQLKEKMKGHQARIEDSNHLLQKLQQSETEKLQLRQNLKEKKENIKKTDNRKRRTSNSS